MRPRTGLLHQSPPSFLAEKPQREAVLEPHWASLHGPWLRPRHSPASNASRCRPDYSTGLFLSAPIHSHAGPGAGGFTSQGPSTSAASGSNLSSPVPREHKVSAAHPAWASCPWTWGIHRGGPTRRPTAVAWAPGSPGSAVSSSLNTTELVCSQESNIHFYISAQANRPSHTPFPHALP